MSSMFERKAIRYYNKKAQELNEAELTYDSTNSYRQYFFRHRASQVISALALCSSERMLEVGCGSGYYEQELQKIPGLHVGTDFSTVYVRQSAALSDAAFFVSDASHLPFVDNYFDKVLCTEVIEHLPVPTIAINELYRVLKPGGSGVITTPNCESYMNKAYRHKSKHYEFNEHIFEFNESTFRNMLQPFHIDEISYTNFGVPYPLDRIAQKLSNPIMIHLLSRVERTLERSRFRRMGWTMIAKVSKSYDRCT